jgi:hypothetical protein
MLKNLIPKRDINKEYKFVTISSFFIVMETSSHIIWHAINKHDKKNYNYEKK